MKSEWQYDWDPGMLKNENPKIKILFNAGWTHTENVEFVVLAKNNKYVTEGDVLFTICKDGFYIFKDTDSFFNGIQSIATNDEIPTYELLSDS